jgi:hypothetical protein
MHGPRAECNDERLLVENRRCDCFGRVSSFAALEEADLDFWSRWSLGEKFQATIELVNDSWYLQGNDRPVPRLDQSVGGDSKPPGSLTEVAAARGTLCLTREDPVSMLLCRMMA